MKVEQLFPVAKDLAIGFPDGTPTGIKLKVVGQDSRQFREVAKRAGQLLIDGNKPSVDELERQNAELTAACIVGWSGLDGADDLPLPYSPEKALELMLTPELSFMREQVEGFISKRLHFFRSGTGEAGGDHPPAHPAGYGS